MFLKINKLFSLDINERGQVKKSIVKKEILDKRELTRSNVHWESRHSIVILFTIEYILIYNKNNETFLRGTQQQQNIYL